MACRPPPRLIPSLVLVLQWRLVFDTLLLVSTVRPAGRQVERSGTATVAPRIYGCDAETAPSSPYNAPDTTHHHD